MFRKPQTAYITLAAMRSSCILDAVDRQHDYVKKYDTSAAMLCPMENTCIESELLELYAFTFLLPKVGAKKEIIFDLVSILRWRHKN